MTSRRFESVCMFVAVAAGLLCIFGCNNNQPDDGTCDPAAPDCPEGFVCEAVSGSPTGLCVKRVIIRGKVLNVAGDAPIGGALVQAVDASGAAVGTLGQTDADGVYEITVPVIRDENGDPIDTNFTLHAQAARFQNFPSAIRPARPVSTATAVLESDPGPTAAGAPRLVIENALTSIKLIALPGDTSQLGSISGTIQAERSAGLLVVAEGGGDALVGFSDAEGHYTIFNVPAGTYAVDAYAAGVQIDPEITTLEAMESQSGVDLAEVDRPLNSVSGSVQIVNAPGGLRTSVVLAVESTFEDAIARGEVPPGLRVGEIDGAFTIADVPDGDYVLLAAFENDELVRDPDESISGTQIVHLTVPDPVQGNDLTISAGFKITEALAVIRPGADGPEAISTATPALEWADDSSEDGYALTVYDAFGNLVWDTELPSVSGSATITQDYAGPPLQIGMFYQFKVASFREQTGQRTTISATEDLRGVFYYLGDGAAEP